MNEILISNFSNNNLEISNNNFAIKEELLEEIEKLKLENIKLERKLKIKKRRSFDEIINELKEEYLELSEISLKALATAEYLFRNENSNMDYATIYSEYVKVLEIEFKKKTVARRKNTFGSMLGELKKKKEFKTFVEALEINRIKEIRNKGTHSRVVNKTECGIIRKLLIDEGWLRRILYLLTEEQNQKVISKKLIETMILSTEEKLKVGTKYYNNYLTDSGEYILTKSMLHIGTFYGEGEVVEINDLEYIMLS